jgi:ABC-type transport system involved in multi-copper enzyme maturation permease subunit
MTTDTMKTDTITAYHSDQPTGRDGFAQLIHAEWTKLRTVRGWLIGLLIAAALTIGLGLLSGGGGQSSCGTQRAAQPAQPQACQKPPSPPTGPGGEPVTDSFYFAHQPLTGNGSITVQISSLTGLIPSPNPSPDAPLSAARPGVQPWAKAGLIIKANTTTQGSAYAAIMITGSHGVRWQYDYTHDSAGLAGTVSAAAPRWLRLTRSGNTITGSDSTDGAHWTTVGSTRLAGLPTTAPAGLFVASPDSVQFSNPIGGGTSTNSGGPTLATATFEQLSLPDGWSPSAWTGQNVGGTQFGGTVPDGFTQSGGALTVRGSGDIAPIVIGSGSGADADHTLIGSFAALIALIVIASLFITSEYRRGLIRTTLAASPRRGRILAAKAIVIGLVAFLVGLVSAGIAVPLGHHIATANGHQVFPVGTATEARMIIGTAALLAVAAAAALAVATMLRRGAGAVTVLIVAIVLPYILATASLLPLGATQWLLRVTPAAAFAVQQSLVRYPQVAGDYAPTNGYYPLAPWAGFAVLCAYAGLALGGAAALLRRRDA